MNLLFIYDRIRNFVVLFLKTQFEMLVPNLFINFYLFLENVVRTYLMF